MRNQAKKYASLLIISYRINDGDDLVLILGSGTEHNNKDALTHWICEQPEFIERYHETSSNLHEVLSDKLRQKLFDVTGGY